MAREHVFVLFSILPRDGASSCALVKPWMVGFVITPSHTPAGVAVKDEKADKEDSDEGGDERRRAAAPANEHIRAPW